MIVIEAARQIRKLIELTACNLTDEQAASLPYCFPEWEEGLEVKEGERYAVRSNAISTLGLDDEEINTQEELVLFKCVKSHTTEVLPEESPEYWVEIGKGE